MDYEMEWKFLAVQMLGDCVRAVGEMIAAPGKTVMAIGETLRHAAETQRMVRYERRERDRSVEQFRQDGERAAIAEVAVRAVVEKQRARAEGIRSRLAGGDPSEISKFFEEVFGNAFRASGKKPEETTEPAGPAKVS